jgi:hypothetical protein
MPQSLTIRGQKNLESSDGWPDLCSFLSFIFEDAPTQKENWLKYRIKFSSPTRTLEFASDNFLLCFKPTNELEQLKKELKTFLSSKQKTYRFEPVEPNFELVFEKDDEGGIKLYCWVDNGNAECSHYTWDAIGLRLYCGAQDFKWAFEDDRHLNF